MAKASAARSTARVRTEESRRGERTVRRLSAVDLSKATTALIVSFHKIGNHRKVSASMVEVNADKEWISVSKKIFDSPELIAVNGLDNHVRKFLETRALPSMLAKGIYLLPNTFVEEVSARLKQFSTERDVLVEKFVKVYERTVSGAESHLKDLYDGGDYPSVEAMQRMFHLTWRYVSFNTPASLEHISAEIYKEEKEKAQAQWIKAEDAIQQLLRASMADLVNHLVGKLTPEEGGKKKIFKDKSIAKLRDFLTTFKQRNVTDDRDLARLVSDAEKLIDGTTPDLLRTDESQREFVRAGFEKIQKAMTGMIEERPRRALTFQDED